MSLVCLLFTPPEVFGLSAHKTLKIHPESFRFYPSLLVEEDLETPVSNPQLLLIELVSRINLRVGEVDEDVSLSYENLKRREGIRAVLEHKVITSCCELGLIQIYSLHVFAL